VAARSKAWVCGCSSAEIVGSNPTGSMDVCLECCVLSGSGLCDEDRLCGLVVRVSGYRYRGPGFDPRRYQIFLVVVGLERGPLSLVRSN